MKILDYLKDNTLIITNNAYKKEILLNTNKLFNIKFMTFNEFLKNLTFSYNENAIYYLIKEYNYKYDVAKMYLDNIYYIDNIDNKKINHLKKLKQELEDKNLLIKNEYFNEYLKRTNIIIYNYELNKFENKIINKFNNITILNDDIEKKDISIHEFKTLDEEIIYVAINIIELINKGISLKNIKISNIDDTYFNKIERIFKLFNLSLDLDNNYIYSNIGVNKFLEKLKDTKNIEESLKVINNDNIYELVLRICNKYSFVELDDYIISCIEEEIKKTKTKDIKENIKIVDLNNITDDDYVFLMNFNQNNIPTIHKDEDYLSDKEKELLNIDTSSSLNKLEEKKLINNIYKIKNLTITYKLKDQNKEYYESYLISKYNFNVIKEENKKEFLYSNLYNKIELTKDIDKLIKYNEKDKNLDLLASNTDVDYSTYDNKFTGIDTKDLYDYLNNELLLSYTSMNNYYKCSFRYYLSNILRLDKSETTFFMFVGNLFHHILEVAFKDGFNFEKEFNDYIKDKEFSNKENFFLEKLKKELLFVIETIKKQNSLSSFDKESYEESVYINEEKTIKVTFMGKIDKIKYKEINGNNYVAIIDYKTGTPETNLKNTIYGIEMQLPVYLYLVKNKIKNAKVMGIYLQKIVNKKLVKDIKKDYQTELENNLKLEGYSTDNEDVLKEFDKTYNDSMMIKSMKTTQNGFYAYSKILTDEEMDALNDIVAKKIKDAEDNILNAKFDINPKRIGEELEGCKYCKFKDICYMKEKNVENLEEYKDLSFLKEN